MTERFAHPTVMWILRPFASLVLLLLLSGMAAIAVMSAGFVSVVPGVLAALGLVAMYVEFRGLAHEVVVDEDGLTWMSYFGRRGSLRWPDVECIIDGRPSGLARGRFRVVGSTGARPVVTAELVGFDRYRELVYQHAPHARVTDRPQGLERLFW